MRFSCLNLILGVCLSLSFTGSRFVLADKYAADIQPLLKKYCFECHGAGDEVNGEVDFTKIKTAAQVDASFEQWESAVGLVEAGEMPPEDSPQMSDVERAVFVEWYSQRFIDSVEAKPHVFQPRRLSAHEYRNTMRSMFGFDLEVDIVEAQQTVVEKSMVMKLLPTDPRGKSGFKNDTHNNPLSAVIWDQYSYLADTALEQLFSKRKRKILEKITGPIAKTGPTYDQAELLVRDFVPRAYRRDVDEQKIQEILIQLKQADKLVSALKVELKTVLMSPGFLYRGILMKKSPGQQQPVDDFELAERISYFLWADMPDARLLSIASQGKLRDPSVLDQEITRMLKSPKSMNLAEDFATQWLSLNEINNISNDPILPLSLLSQPVDFMNYLFTQDRPLMELIDSDVAFVNPNVRGFYGKDAKQMTSYRKQKGIEREVVPNQQIRLENTNERGGILTMPGIVAMNKGPVLRGTWILERILGQHLPDPPANVGQVKANSKGENLTFRERFELHRSNQTCAVCHNKIDPLGFSLQGYDEKGGYILADDYEKTQKNKKTVSKKGEVIDTSGKMPSGEEFNNFYELKEILITGQREVIIRNIVKKTLSYALCRELKLHDQPTVEDIVDKLNKNNGTYRDLIHEVVNSLPFQETILLGEKI
ncbi:MAG: DUF1592 domain-containing protein [Pirellulales bacterium]